MKKNTEENVTQSKEAATATRLKLLRVQNGLTQASLAKELGVSQQSYSNLEKAEGRFDVTLLKKLCDYYGVSSDYILGLDENPKRATEVKLISEMNMIKMLTSNKQ